MKLGSTFDWRVMAPVSCAARLPQWRGVAKCECGVMWWAGG